MHHSVPIGEFKLELQSGNAQFRSKSTIFFSRVTFKFYGWPSKPIGHPFHATSSSVHHFVPIGEFKLDLQSGNAKLGQIRRFLEPCDLEIWRITLKNNRAPLLCYFKLCASFRSHWWIQTGVTVRKRPIWVKFNDFLRPVTLKFDVWPCKTIGHLFYATSSFVHHFVAIGEFELFFFYSPETPNLGQIWRFFEPRDLEIWRMTLKNNRAPLLSNIKLYA